MRNTLIRGFAVVTFVLLEMANPMAQSKAETHSSPGVAELRENPRFQEATKLLEIWAGAMVDYQKLPGLVMGVVYDQDLVWSHAFGYSDVESKTPTTTGTIYSICSISKLFTSIGVMQLRDAGKLRLDDAVSDHIPWFRIQDTFPQDLPVTVRGLLTHSSGLPRETIRSYWSGPDFEFPTRQEVIEGISDQQTLYPSSRYFQYSNLGLMLAGEIIQQESGLSYEEYVESRILTPLDLRDTTPQLPPHERGLRLATGYSTLDREGKRDRLPFFQARGLEAAAGFASTVGDLAKFASWQFRTLEGQETILRAATLRDMQRVQWVDEDWNAESYRGLGFKVWRDRNRTFVGHGGGCPGYRTEFSLDTKRKVAAIAMINAVGVSPTLFTSRAHQILGNVLESATKSPPTRRESQADSLSTYTGFYRSIWEEQAVVVWEGALAKFSLPVGDPLGAMEKLKKTGEHTFRRVREDGELGEEVRFELDEEGQVRRLWQHGNFSVKVR